MKKLILICICLFTRVVLQAQESKIANVTVSGSLSTITSSYANTVTELSVTGTIDARDFKSLRDNMPGLEVLDLSEANITSYTGTKGTSGSSSVTYPDNTIPDNSFFNFLTNSSKTTLKSIILPKSLTSIGTYAFYGCKGLLGTVSIPSQVISINNFAFSSCSKLSTITFEATSRVSFIGNDAFSDCRGLTGTLSIPASVTSIGINAYANCTKLTTVTFEQNSTLTILGNNAFRDCSGLTGAFTIPATVVSIGNSAFENCSRMLSITFDAPSALTEIGDYAFAGCGRLTGKLVIPSKVITIGNSAFQHCSGFSSVVIPSSVTSIGSSAFYYCSGLTTIYAYPSPPVSLIFSPNVFSNVNKATCKLFVPEESKSAYSIADQWEDFQNVDYYTLTVSTNTVKLIKAASITTPIQVTSNTSWTAVSDQSWLNVSPDLLTTGNATLTFTVPQNNLPTDRQAKVTVSADGVNTQIITVTQMGKIPLAVTNPVITTSKVYDRTTTALVAMGTLSGFEGGDESEVIVTATASYNNVNVGTGKTITVSYALSGALASKYIAPDNYIVSNGVITSKELAVLNAVANNKVYDGTTVATIEGAVLIGVIEGDNIALDNCKTGNFAQKNIGKGIAVTPAMIITGSGIANYKLTQPTGLKADITVKALTVVAAVAQNKIYDGSIAASVLGAILQGVVAGENVFLNADTVGTFSKKEIGINIPVSTLMTIVGSDIGNYKLNQPDSLKATITARKLKITNAVAKDKPYDGTTVATVEGAILQGVIAGDKVLLSDAKTGFFAQKEIGTNIIVTPTFTIVGSDIGNYTYAQPTGLKAAITPKVLTITGAVVKDKVYDGTPVATIVGATLVGVVEGEKITLIDARTGVFAQKNVGNNIAVTISMTIEGVDIANYTFTQPTNLNANITAKELTISGAIACDKIYDGTTVAIIDGGVLNGILGGDVVMLDAVATGKFIQKNIGTNITIIPLLTLNGNDKANYSVIQPLYLKANITFRELTITGSIAKDKVYDGTTIATIEGATLIGAVAGDNITLVTANTSHFTKKTVGTNIIVTPSMTLAGSDMINYNLIQPATLMANITTKNLKVINIVVKNKVYDGTTVATIEGATLSGVVANDNVTLLNNTSGKFAQKSIGTNIEVTHSMMISGDDITNYSFTEPSGLKATITPKELTVKNAVAESKEYDCSNAAHISRAVVDGVVGVEDVNLANQTNGVFAYSSVGTDIEIVPLMTITGEDIANYILTIPTGLKADITPKQLTVTDPTTTVCKVYDGCTSASTVAGLLQNVMPADEANVTLIATANYNDPTVGTGKAITVSYSLGGTAGRNYIAPLNYRLLMGEIMGKQLTISAPIVTINKMYDGTTTVFISSVGNLQGVEPIDQGKVTVTAVANYNNAMVGVDKTITIVYTLSGSSMSNYIVPVNLEINKAIISEVITLNQVETRTAGCEGSDLELAYNILTGAPTQYKISFDAEALAAGFVDIGYTNLPLSANGRVLDIPILAGMHDGIYKATLQMQNAIGVESPTYTFQISINLSSDYIITKYEDVVLFDNSCKRFSAYQWFKNGYVIEGATDQFYCDPTGLDGVYSLNVWTADGKMLATCPKILNIPLVKKVKVYPSPVKINQTFTVQLSAFIDEELEGAVLFIYNLQGVSIYNSTKVELLNFMNLPTIDGIYVGRVTTAKGIEYQFKVVVVK